jgi:uncharacterized protein YndB with AHSA1/START domain
MPVMDEVSPLDEVSREVELEAGIEEVWEALASPAGWLADEAALELVPGGEAQFVVDGEQRPGWVEDVVPGQRLVFWWGEPATRVVLELEEVDDALTRVRVCESRPLEVVSLAGGALPGRGGPAEGPVLLAA